jgi:hypothetical protein
MTKGLVHQNGITKKQKHKTKTKSSGLFKSQTPRPAELDDEDDGKKIDSCDIVVDLDDTDGEDDSDYEEDQATDNDEYVDDGFVTFGEEQKEVGRSTLAELLASATDEDPFNHAADRVWYTMVENQLKAWKAVAGERIPPPAEVVSKLGRFRTRNGKEMGARLAAEYNVSVPLN